MAFKEITPYELSENTFKLISKDWMLITAGDKEDHNTMTASWGGLGFLWNKPVSTVYIRPQRYTLGFVDEQDHYSLCFFDEEYRKALNFCGAKSGRDYDKDKETGLICLSDEAAPYYEQAKLVLICKKLYRQEMTEDSFLIKDVCDTNYPDKDFHRIFIGEIVKVLQKI